MAAHQTHLAKSHLYDLPVPIDGEWENARFSVANKEGMTNARKKIIADIEYVMPQLFALADEVLSAHEACPFTSVISDEFSARQVSLFLHNVLRASAEPVKPIFFIRPPGSSYDLDYGDYLGDVPSPFLEAMTKLHRDGFHDKKIGNRPLIVTEWLMTGGGISKLVESLQAINPSLQITVAALETEKFVVRNRLDVKIPIIEPANESNRPAGSILYHADWQFDIVRRGWYRGKEPWIPGFLDEAPKSPVQINRQRDIGFIRSAFISLCEYYLSDRNGDAVEKK